MLASGYTVNVFVDKKKMKSIKIPNDIRIKIKIDLIFKLFLKNSFIH